MKTRTTLHSHFGLRAQPTRGSVLITALIFGIFIAITLGSYLKLSTNSLKLSHRTFFADAANNLAEAGLEEAVWSFNQLGYATSSSAIAAAWQSTGSVWTLSNTVADAYMERMGSGYSSAPTVTFSTEGGGATAEGTATIASFETTTGGITTTVTGVSGITITHPGSGYTSAPTITLSGGGGSGAVGRARLAATRTLTFTNLDQNASATVKVWVAGYDGTAVVPIVVSKATITPYLGSNDAPIEKTVKVILNKSGLLTKGLVAKDGISWSGHPSADSYVSSTTPGVPPFTPYATGTRLLNMTVASVDGSINLGAQGDVFGNVMTGPGVTVSLGNGTITGQQIGNFSYSFELPIYPTDTGATGYYNLGSGVNVVPATLPRPAVGGASPTPADLPAADGNYYYFVNGATIGATSITAGANIVIVGTSTRMTAGLDILVSGTTVGSAKIYMDGPVDVSGTGTINPSSWAGALNIYTTTYQDCAISGNAAFYGCLFAPNSALRANGGGSTDINLCGSFVVGSVTANGHVQFHYDEALGGIPNARPWSLALWTEMQTAAERAVYAEQLSF